MSLRIGFMGTPEFAATALRALHDSAHDVVCVYSQPPRPKGRGHKVQLSPVHAYAEEAGISVFTPLHFKDQDVRDEFAAHNLDIAIVAAYGLLLPEEVLSAPKYGCINIHASLLPRWRGASPIQQAIWAGDQESGVTIMQMDKGLDTGSMISKCATPITAQTTAKTLHDELAGLGAGMTLEVLDILGRAGALSFEAQDDAQTTYAPLLKKLDAQIDWTQTALQIDRQIRALNPWPGVWTMLDGKRIKILEAVHGAHESKERAGTITDRAGYISCGDNTALQIKILQPEGKKSMDFAAAVNGGYIGIGAVFS